MFIKLTEKATDPNALLPIFVAVEYIQYMQWDNQEQLTQIGIPEGYINTTETPEEILAIIRASAIEQSRALYNQAMEATRGEVVENPGYIGPLRHPSDYLLAEWPSKSVMYKNRARVSPGYEGMIPSNWKIIPVEDKSFYEDDGRILPPFMSLKRFPQDFPEGAPIEDYVDAVEREAQEFKAARNGSKGK